MWGPWSKGAVAREERGKRQHMFFLVVISSVSHSRMSCPLAIQHSAAHDPVFWLASVRPS